MYIMTKYTIIMCGKHLANLINNGDGRVIDVQISEEVDCEYSDDCSRNNRQTSTSSERFKVIFLIESYKLLPM